MELIYSIVNIYTYIAHRRENEDFFSVCGWAVGELAVGRMAKKEEKKKLKVEGNRLNYIQKIITIKWNV